MAGSIGGNLLCLDQHVILFQLCRMTESNSFSQLTVLKTEGYLLGALLFYCLFAIWGSSTNSKKAKNWHVLIEISHRLLLLMLMFSFTRSGWHNTFQYTSNNSPNPSKRMAWW